MKKPLNILFTIIKWIIIVLVCSYIGLITFLLSKENNMMYWGQNGKALMNDEIPNSFKEGFIETKLGKIQFYKKEGSSNYPAIFYFGGNGEHANLSLDWLSKDFTNNEVYALNFPGYGKSENKPNQKNIEKMFLEATEKLQNNKKVILIGRSLGTGFSTYVANHLKNVEGLVLITPYSKITDVACERFIYVPSIVCSALMENQMDDVKNISNINEPIFIIFANGE